MGVNGGIQLPNLESPRVVLCSLLVFSFEMKKGMRHLEQTSFKNGISQMHSLIIVKSVRGSF